MKVVHSVHVNIIELGEPPGCHPKMVDCPLLGLIAKKITQHTQKNLGSAIHSFGALLLGEVVTGFTLCSRVC